jgi:hypothetical protein
MPGLAGLIHPGGSPKTAPPRPPIGYLGGIPAWAPGWLGGILGAG